ncbi:MAG: hypothetical protein ACOVLG_05490 [Flavobacterium sp.]
MKVRCIIFLSLYSILTYSQERIIQKKFCFLSSNLKYEVVIESSNLNKGLIRNIGYRIKLELDVEKIKDFDLLDCNQIMSLLKNKRTDWNTNLILYQIYNKDASLFINMKNRKDWIKFAKLEDIEFWEKKFSNY